MVNPMLNDHKFRYPSLFLRQHIERVINFSFIIPQIKQASSLARAALATLAFLPRKIML